MEIDFHKVECIGISQEKKESLISIYTGAPLPKGKVVDSANQIHSKNPHVATMLRLDSDWMVTILSPTSTSGTSGRLQNCVSVPP